MNKAKPVGCPLASHFKLSSNQCPTSEKDKEEMQKVPYASVVGSLMYAMVCTRPNIAHIVGVVSRFLSNPGKEHWAAIKWILRYLRGTSKVCLCFGDGKPMLDGFTDSDMAGDIDSRKSTSGNIVQVARRKYDGRIRSCRIHDLLHNVCIRVATESNFFGTPNHATPSNFALRGVRRVTIYGNSVWEYISSNFQTSRLRTILCFPEKERRVPKRKQVNKFFQGSRFLRVLSIDCHDILFQLPNQIGNLRHLRYFRCEHRSIKLPLTMGKLKNLMTLDIQIGHRIHIPKAIWEMEQLRHIVVDKRSIQWPPQDCRDLVCKYSFRQSEVSLPNLQTLYVVPGPLLEAEWLHKCPNLRKLGISNPTKSIIKVLSEEAPVSNKL
ncbi:hypothetical protein HYC85_015986 [Camellia sinensis]|uniref:Disease resistance R13L4/SHOC-2-like LRR domain-containing protein n=1 Tax=Camellia sinensis TaxID=4442 RepID=A0A7J7H218_CAMSI|nr:hypothetical protein HYC85_015986 [Camellia sinensis]